MDSVSWTFSKPLLDQFARPTLVGLDKNNPPQNVFVVLGSTDSDAVNGTSNFIAESNASQSILEMEGKKYPKIY